MPSPNPSMLKHPSATDVFLSRTKASDWDWAQQALAMGFSPFTALSKETSWALAAARHDQKHGARLALRLTQDLIETLTISTKRDAIDALSELCACITGAIEHGNHAFLVGLEPAFEALPHNARVKGAQLLNQRVESTRPWPLGQIVWGEILAVARQDKKPRDWSWTQQLPWPSPLVMVDGLWSDLWTMVGRHGAGGCTEAYVQDLVTQLGDRVTPEAVDRAFMMVRGPEDKVSTSTVSQLADLVHVLGTLPSPPSTVSNGRDLMAELRRWSEVLPDAQKELHSVAQFWEVALLRKVADDNAAAPDARVRSRL